MTEHDSQPERIAPWEIRTGDTLLGQDGTIHWVASIAAEWDEPKPGIDTVVLRIEDQWGGPQGFRAWDIPKGTDEPPVWFEVLDRVTVASVRDGVRYLRLAAQG